MKLLLDTHALYWYVADDPQLSATAKNAIQDASNEVLVSPATFWEIAIKVSLGKWKLLRPFEEFVDIALNQYQFQLFPILPAHTAKVIDLPFHHKDPFDRLLVAQSLAEQLSIVSNDQALDAYGVTRLW